MWGAFLRMLNTQTRKSNSSNHDQDSLLHKLRDIRFLLERENEARLIVAHPTLAETKNQQLPPHIKFANKKRTGPRISVRGSRNSSVPRMIQARWPKDGLAECTLPNLGYVVQGPAELHINDYMMYCQTGDCIFQPAGIATSDGSKPHFEDHSYFDRQCSLLWIYPGRLNGEGLECYICHSQGNAHSTGKRLWCRNHLLAELFQGIQEECQKPNRQQGIFHLLSALLFTLHQEINDGRAGLAPYYPTEETTSPAGHDPIRRACAYINSHLDSNLTIDVVARYVCLSASAFTRQFKQQTGQTFNQYCTSVRMKQAAILLAETEVNILGVSRAVGLTDCRFRQLALHHWGCLPREFRKQDH